MSPRPGNRKWAETPGTMSSRGGKPGSEWSEPLDSGGASVAGARSASR